MKKRIALTLAAALLLGCLTACGGGEIAELGNDNRLSTTDPQMPSGSSDAPTGSGTTESPTESTSGIVLERYTGDGFSLLVPQGWTISIVGDGVTFGFWMQDPQDDTLAVFHYGKLEPFLKSEEARKSWKYWGPRTGDGRDYFGQAPVCWEKTAKGLIECMDECLAFQQYLGQSLLFPQLSNKTVISCENYSGALASVGVPETVAVASCTTPSGRDAYLTMTAAIFDPGYLDIFEEGIDTYYMTAYEVNGIVMPQTCSEDWAKALAACAGSLQFTEEFVARAMQQSNEQLAAIRQRSAENEALMDALMRKWGY